jgi:hypothetical protein
MSFSLAIISGDISPSAGGLSTVTGAQKLGQDLTSLFLTHLGSNPYNPSYGSLIDGGVRSDGTVVPSPIGSSNIQSVQASMTTEINRLVSLYQAQQTAKINSDLSLYNKITLSPDEMLQSVSSIDFTISFDYLIINITIQTGSNDSVTVTVPLQGSTI